MTQLTQAKQREIHAQDYMGAMRGQGAIRAIGAHNPITAQLGVEAGFDAIWASGLELSASQLLPDTDILGAAGTMNLISPLARTCNAPLIVDFDAGYGNAVNAYFAAHEMFGAGVAALCVEDKIFPKRNSFLSDAHNLEPVSVFVGKISAMLEARHNDQQHVIARTEALIAGGTVDEALERAHAYADAGAHMVLIHDKQAQPDCVLEFATRWKSRTPLAAVPTTYNSVQFRELADAGFNLVIYANQGMRSMIQTLRANYKKILNDGNTSKIEQDIAAVSDIFSLQMMSEQRRIADTHIPHAATRAPAEKR